MILLGIKIALAVLAFFGTMVAGTFVLVFLFAAIGAILDQWS
jgi:hypothetical protein